jgi:hypothetical protein
VKCIYAINPKGSIGVRHSSAGLTAPGNLSLTAKRSLSGQAYPSLRTSLEVYGGLVGLLEFLMEVGHHIMSVTKFVSNHSKAMQHTLIHIAWLI